MTQSELSEHLNYLTDGPKLAAYERAFAEVVRPGAVVVDLGCGTGLLGLLALRAGAAKVYAIDSGAILGLAREIAFRNGLADQVVHLRSSSVDTDLPELADVVVADQMGGVAYDAGVLQFFHDARRFLKPDGVLVPNRFSLFAAAVTNVAGAEAVSNWRDHRPSELDFSAAADLAANTVLSVHLGADALLSEPALLCDRLADDVTKIDAKTETVIVRSATLHGVLGMFRSQMSPTVTMSNVPGAEDRMARRWQNHYPLEHPCEVREGDLVTFELKADPMTYRAQWRITVRSAAGDVRRDERHGTFLGEFMDTRELDRNRPERLIGPSPRLDLWEYSLGRVKAGINRPDLERELVQHFPTRFRSASDVERFVVRLQGAVET